MRTPFKLRSGNSPVKQGGIILKGLKYVGKKLFSKKGGATVMTAGGAKQAVSDNTKNRSTVEKVVRAADEWGPTMGLVSSAYDNVKEGKTSLPEAKATAFSGGKTWTEAKESGGTKSTSNRGFNFNKGK